LETFYSTDNLITKYGNNVTILLMNVVVLYQTKTIVFSFFKPPLTETLAVIL